jgi:hypothetical protein
MGTALTKEIPALVERLFKIMEACCGVAHLARVLLHCAAQLMFSVDHLANAREDVGVVHMAQPRGAYGCGLFAGQLGTAKMQHGRPAISGGVLIVILVSETLSPGPDTVSPLARLSHSTAYAPGAGAIVNGSGASLGCGQYVVSPIGVSIEDPSGKSTESAACPDARSRPHTRRSEDHERCRSRCECGPAGE